MVIIVVVRVQLYGICIGLDWIWIRYCLIVYVKSGDVDEHAYECGDLMMGYAIRYN